VRKTSETNAEEVGLFMAGLFEGRRAQAAEIDTLSK
jgi:general nucleoside transport system ATP-binding protein